MTDREALMATIRQSPHDDFPRLIYADWHEEKGSPLYAGFVRAQVELARLPRVRTLILGASDVSETVLGKVTAEFMTEKRVDAGEMLDLTYPNGLTLTATVRGVKGRLGSQQSQYSVSATVQGGRDHGHRRDLKETVRRLWREGEVVRYAVPDSLKVDEVGLAYRSRNRGIVERGMVGTLILGEMDAEEIYDAVRKTHPVTRIVLAGDWSMGVEERVRVGYLPDDVPLDMQWRTNDGRHMFVSEMENGHLVDALGFVTRSPHWRQDCRYVLEREAERRGLAPTDANG